jgi:hypothetical protein
VERATDVFRRFLRHVLLSSAQATALFFKSLKCPILPHNSIASFVRVCASSRRSMAGPFGLQGCSTCRVSPQRIVPDTIPKPDWATTGIPAAEMNSRNQSSIPVSNQAQLDKFQAACELGRAILDEAHRHIKPGVTTDEIDRVRIHFQCQIHWESYVSSVLFSAVPASSRMLDL